MVIEAGILTSYTNAFPLRLDFAFRLFGALLLQISRGKLLRPTLILPIQIRSLAGGVFFIFGNVPKVRLLRECTLRFQVLVLGILFVAVDVSRLRGGLATMGIVVSIVICEFARIILVIVWNPVKSFLGLG